MLVVKKGLLAFIVLFLAISPIELVRADDFYYRGPKINPAQIRSSLFITPVKSREGNLISIDIVVDPAGEEINAVTADIIFDKNKLALKKISKKESFCSFFLEEVVSNKKGSAKFSCLKPYPGTDQRSNIISLTFEIRASGRAEISLGNDSLVLANDGYGTNVLKEKIGQKIFVQKE